MYLGVDLGGTNIKAGVVSENGQLIDSISRPTNANEGRSSVITKVVDIIKDLINSSSSDVKSIGIGVPGVVNNDGMIYIAPNLPSWKNVPLKKLMKENFDLPIGIDNDANVAAFAELKLGSGRHFNDFIYITLGTGVGGTIISNGEIFRGQNGGAGEIGHIIIDSKASTQDYPNTYRAGTLEEIIGREKIIILARNIAKMTPESTLNNYENLDVKDIDFEAREGDKAAIECFALVGNYLGIGITSIMNLLDIPTAIIGGGIAKANELIFNKALQTMKVRALPPIAEKATILTAQFSNEAGIIGAAMLGKNLINNK